MLSIFQQSGYFFYRNYLYFLPVIVAFVLFASLLAKPEMPQGSTLSMNELATLYMQSNLYLLYIAYLFGFPFVLAIAKRRINAPDESIATCLTASFFSCWQAIISFGLVLLTLGAAVWLAFSLLSSVLGLYVSMLYLIVMALAIYTMLRLSLLLPALVEDRLLPHQAVLRSFAATRGRIWMVLGAYALIFAISIGLILVLNLLSLVAGTWLGNMLAGLVDIHLNVLLLIVFYRLYLLHKSGELDSPNDEGQFRKL